MFTFNCKGKLLNTDKPLVMGIINTTPDSFYKGSRFQGVDAILWQAEQMLKDGAAIIDIGGQSTRPSSEWLNASAELERVLPAIESLCYNFPEAVISIDTFYAEVARRAVAAGAGIINDISGGNLDSEMIAVAGHSGATYICMHMRGTPQSMQQQADYEDVAKEVMDYFIEKTATCKAAGIKDLIIDPGFGFAKTAEQGFELFRKLSILSTLEKPILIGISRKSFIYRTLNITAEEALNATTALHMAGLLKGASILRAHDVKEASQTIELFMHMRG